MITQQWEADEKFNQNLNKSKLSDHVCYATLSKSNNLKISTEELSAHHKSELAMAHQYHSVGPCFGPEIMKLTIDSVKSDSATFLNPYWCAATLVIEARPTYNMVSDCSELELVHTPDDYDTTITMCYTHTNTKLENEVNCKEESRVNSDNLASLTRATPQKNGFNLDEELSKDVIPFASSDDGASRNESTFGVFSNNKRDFNYSNNSYKARIVGRPVSSGAYCEADKPYKSHDHQLTLPYPIDTSNDSPVKKLVTG